MPYLLDTDVVSELRTRKPHGAVVAWLEQLPEEALFVSVVTLGEIQAGVELTRDQDAKKAAKIGGWTTWDRRTTSSTSMPQSSGAGPG